MRRTRVFNAWAALIVLCAGGLAAQTNSDDVDTQAIRAYLLQAFQRNLELDLAYLAAAPDSMLRWAPAEDVRDFTQQIAHTTHDFFRPWREGAPMAADTVRYLNDRDVLAQHLTDGYGWILEQIVGMTPSELTAPMSLDQMGEHPVWRVYTYWVEHAMWTRATTVPYLRINGVSPPRVRFFR